MSRSLKKGPYIEVNLLEKVDAAVKEGNKKPNSLMLELGKQTAHR